MPGCAPKGESMITVNSQEEFDSYYDPEQRLIYFNDAVEIKYPVRTTESIKAAKSLTMHNPIEVGGSITSYHTIEANASILVGGYIRSGDSISVRGCIDSRHLIMSQGSIEAGYYIKSLDSIVAKKSIKSGNNISGYSIISGGAITANGWITAHNLIEADGAVQTEHFAFSFNHAIVCETLRTKLLPYNRNYWAEMKPLRRWRADILNTDNCWEKLRALFTTADAREICAWDGWHPILRAHLEMFFNLRTEVSGEELGSGSQTGLAPTVTTNNLFRVGGLSDKGGNNDC